MVLGTRVNWLTLSVVNMVSIIYRVSSQILAYKPETTLMHMYIRQRTIQT